MKPAEASNSPMPDPHTRKVLPSGPLGLREMCRRRPLLAFCVLLALFTWPMMVVAGDAVVTYIVLALIGPSACAVILRGIAEGPRAVRDLLRGVIRWRAPWWAWTFALLGNGVLVTAVAVLAVHLLGDGDLDWRPVPMGVTVAVNILLLSIVPGLTEELGWRGYVLPRLLERWGPIRASMGTGTLWALWHAPLILAGGESAPLATLAWFTVGVLGASFAYTWLHTVSGGSLLLAAALHGGENAWTGQLFVMLFGADQELGYAARQVAAVMLALILLVATRGTLGAGPSRKRARALDRGC